MSVNAKRRQGGCGGDDDDDHDNNINNKKLPVVVVIGGGGVGGAKIYKYAINNEKCKWKLSVEFYKSYVKIYCIPKCLTILSLGFACRICQLFINV